MKPEDLGWRYHVTLTIVDDLDGTVTTETISCDKLSEIIDLAKDVTHVLHERDQDES